MHAEVVPSPEGPIFFWNVGKPVGLRSPNQWEDVLFISWCFYKFARLAQTPADLRQIMQNVGVNDSCDGRPDHPLVVAIQAVQRRFHHSPVDGRVSPAKGVTYRHHYGEHAFLIFRLNAVLRVAHPDQYPRLDMMPEFAWRLRKIVKPVFV
jgi:hypothetical protein